MRKKIILFLGLLLFPFMVYADKKTTFSLDTISAKSGSNVTINFNVKDNPAFGVLTAKIHYDITKLEFVDSSVNGLKKAVLKGADNNSSKGLVALYAITLSGKLTDTGNLYTVEFKIKDGVKDNIPLTLEIVDFGEDENTPLEYDKVDGMIVLDENVRTVSKEKKESILSEFKDIVREKEIKEDEVTFSSSDDNKATVDQDGNVTFKGDGNVTIVAKDDNGNVVFSKDYFVKKKLNKFAKYKWPIIIGISLVLLIIIIIIWRCKCKKGK